LTTVEEIKRAIEALPLAEKRRLLSEVIPGLAKEVLRDEELHQDVAEQVKLFGKVAKHMIGKKLSSWSRRKEGAAEDEEPPQ